MEEKESESVGHYLYKRSVHTYTLPVHNTAGKKQNAALENRLGHFSRISQVGLISEIRLNHNIARATLHRISV